MIDVTYLYCGKESISVPHRYGRALDGIKSGEAEGYKVAETASGRKPIVVWNITRTCNMKCLHCYSDSDNKRYEGELSTNEAKAVIDDLAEFKVPALLFSGGEPLMRHDIFKLAKYAQNLKIRTVLSTNGSLITPQIAARIKETGFIYVGISLDGIGETHDRFRGLDGAFEKTLAGFENCIAAGQKTGLRLTLTKHTYKELDKIFALIEEKGINRVCFYHLVPSGRGKDIGVLTNEETRDALDLILQKAKDFVQRGINCEILTVDSHCDGPYIYLKLLEQNDPRAEWVYKVLEWNGGGLYSSGSGISSIDHKGNVHPDQFWMHYTIGSIRHENFSQLWSKNEHLLTKLRDRKKYIKGRCAECRFLDLCGGGFRARAELITGDTWDTDTNCYLTENEISCR
ncbi:MAG: radical SAM protein [Candidatus Desantisbacteria bacterium]